jgi:hypothetical protein
MPAEIGGRCPKHVVREMEGIAPSANSAFLSSAQNLSGKSQESLGIGNGKEGERRGEQGGIGTNTMPFLHLAIRMEDPDAPNREAIEAVLNRAKDWYRYAPNCWLIYTGRSADTWARRIREIPGIEGHTSFLICETPVNDKTKRAGWLPRSVWDWMKKDRSS